jgi:peptidoglycan hydrolase CwlO-like protein
MFTIIRKKKLRELENRIYALGVQVKALKIISGYRLDDIERLEKSQAIHRRTLANAIDIMHKYDTRIEKLEEEINELKKRIPKFL